mgnify:CR=1 FL=1
MMRSIPANSFSRRLEVGTDAAADSDQIVVGSDGTIGTDEVTLPNSTPMSVTQLPVGDFPDGWGIGTDVAIAQNSVFPTPWPPLPSGVASLVSWAMITLISILALCPLAISR